MISSMTKTRWALVTTLVFATSSLDAHEYWLDPIDSSITLGESAIVDIRNGERFSGASFPYDGSQYQSISVANTHGTEQYDGRLGDYPAINIAFNTAGLHAISVDTNPKYLTYNDWKDFTDFLDYHGLVNVADRHSARKLPKQGIEESYTRSAKTLIQVVLEAEAPSPIKATEAGSVLAPSKATFELVLLEDPFRAAGSISAKLLYEGKPLEGRQVEFFWKGTQSIRLTTLTDPMGIASFKLLGEGDYMLNAVHVVEPESAEAHWQSYWASFTFER